MYKGIAVKLERLNTPYNGNDKQFTANEKSSLMSELQETENTLAAANDDFFQLLNKDAEDDFKSK